MHEKLQIRIIKIVINRIAGEHFEIPHFIKVKILHSIVELPSKHET